MDKTIFFIIGFTIGFVFGAIPTWYWMFCLRVMPKYTPISYKKEKEGKEEKKDEKEKKTIVTPYGDIG